MTKLNFQCQSCKLQNSFNIEIVHMANTIVCQCQWLIKSIDKLGKTNLSPGFYFRSWEIYQAAREIWFIEDKNLEEPNFYIIE